METVCGRRGDGTKMRSCPSVVSGSPLFGQSDIARSFPPPHLGRDLTNKPVHIGLLRSWGKGVLSRSPPGTAVTPVLDTGRHACWTLVGTPAADARPPSVKARKERIAAVHAQARSVSQDR